MERKLATAAEPVGKTRFSMRGAAVGMTEPATRGAATAAAAVRAKTFIVIEVSVWVG